MTIGEVADAAGVRASGIRYYESIGVLAEPEREAGQRRYTIEVLKRLAIIDIAQRAGLSLGEVKQLLGGTESRAAHDSIRAIADAKLPAVSALIERAEAVKRWLEIASACECDTLDVCGLFDERAPALAPRIAPDDQAGSINVIAVPAPRHGHRRAVARAPVAASLRPQTDDRFVPEAFAQLPQAGPRQTRTRLVDPGRGRQLWRRRQPADEPSGVLSIGGVVYASGGV